jgi:hypothetical protein
MENIFKFESENTYEHNEDTGFVCIPAYSYITDRSYNPSKASNIDKSNNEKYITESELNSMA